MSVPPHLLGLGSSPRPPKPKEPKVPRRSKRATPSKKVFNYIDHEDLFWEWLLTQSPSNSAVKRFRTHRRKSPMDAFLKLFLRFLREQGYTI